MNYVLILALLLVSVLCFGKSKPKILTTNLPPAQIGGNYSAQLQATHGTPPYRWRVIAGSLPTGLVLSLAGVISGQASAWGQTPATATFTVQVQDAASAQATASESIAVAAQLVLGSALPTSCTQLVVGRAVNCALPVTGGWPPYTCSVVAGALPPGLTLTGCSITGTPTAPTAPASASPFKVAAPTTAAPAPAAPAKVSTMMKILTLGMKH